MRDLFERSDPRGLADKIVIAVFLCCCFFVFFFLHPFVLLFNALKKTFGARSS